MNYEIIGGAFPAVKCVLQKGEAMKCEGGSMSWMDRGLEMSTEGGGGLGRALGRALSGEKIFFNRFACKPDFYFGIDFAVRFYIAWPYKIICNKSA